MIILAIETSCDETAAAVVKNGREILSNVVATQTEFHKKYGGIVPEIASRKHIELINPVIQEALDKALVKFKDLDAVAVTYGPGLVGSLIVGICAAKAIAYALDIPLVGVNHLEAHIHANFLNFKPQTSKSKINPNSQHLTSKPTSHSPFPHFPFICLLVSGGHTMIVLVKGHGKYKVLGRTRDDAAGEAYDKVARFLGLGYPGGPVIDKLAKKGNPKAIHFTRPMLDDGYDFSFSGIKTSVVNLSSPACRQAGRAPRTPVPDIAASFQQAVVDVLVEKTIRAALAYKCKTIALAGGVAANSALRKGIGIGEGLGIGIVIPPIHLCTDNAAMVGCLGYHQLKRKGASRLDLVAVASLPVV